MIRIGLLSDTHNHMDDRILDYLSSCDEIWHAGDIGTSRILDQLAKIKPVRAVYGNVDGQDLRKAIPKDLKFQCEDVKVWITHIGGYPNRYDKDVVKRLKATPPDLFICGHSHILKVIYDKKLKLLHINPGAAGKYGFHKVRTLIRFTIDKSDIKDLEVVELAEKH
ncbi:MAG: metallophosphoesterase family protein [Flavobacteriales bacterium]|nr:metallophosphoesterase family protein [Flavobacteriales bacterium]